MTTDKIVIDLENIET